MNEALVQGVETARAVLTTTPQGQAVDAQFVKWLMDHQKEAGVFTTVSALVDQLSDNPAAKMTAQEIAQRVQQAQQQRTASQAAVAANEGESEMSIRPIISQQGGYRLGRLFECVSLAGPAGRQAGGQLLGFQSHDIPVLIAAKLLQPLGKPVPNAPKYFAACVLEELRCNPDWLDQASRAISRHWQAKNGKRPFPSASEFDDQGRALAARN